MLNMESGYMYYIGKVKLLIKERQGGCEKCIAKQLSKNEAV
jgi:hypothetical protein